ALRAVPEAVPRLPPPAHHGIEREERDARRRRDGLRHRADRVGRAGHERAALLLPADSPGHDARPLRLHRLPPNPQPARPAPPPAPREPPRPGRGTPLLTADR